MATKKYTTGDTPDYVLVTQHWPENHNPNAMNSGFSPVVCVLTVGMEGYKQKPSDFPHTFRATLNLCNPDKGCGSGTCEYYHEKSLAKLAKGIAQGFGMTASASQDKRKTVQGEPYKTNYGLPKTIPFGLEWTPKGLVKREELHK